LRHALIFKPRNLAVESLLPLKQTLACRSHEHRQLGVGAGRAHMPDHDIAAVTTLRDLDLRAARPTWGLPHEHHQPDPTEPRVFQSGAALLEGLRGCGYGGVCVA
jgi:hypothetical protein